MVSMISSVSARRGFDCLGGVARYELRDRDDQGSDGHDGHAVRLLRSVHEELVTGLSGEEAQCTPEHLVALSRDATDVDFLGIGQPEAPLGGGFDEVVG